MNQFSFLRIKNKLGQSPRKNSAFTVVELLVVIVVIAILATISIVAYTGVRQKAVAASLQSDLSNASKQIEIYKTEHEVYPGTIDDCPTPSDGNICLVSSSGNTFSGYTVDNYSGTYYLRASNGDVAYYITQNTTPSEGATSWSSVSVRGSNACAISSSNKLFCWGDNYYGQIGDGTNNSQIMPTAVYTSGALSGKTISQISTGVSHTCAVATDGTAYCWGDNTYGELGIGTVAMNNGAKVADLSDSMFDSYGIANIVEDSTSLEAAAVDMSGVLSGKTIKYISAGYERTCAIASDNQAYCWGWGALGDGNDSQSATPVAVDTSGVLSGKTINKISTGPLSTCVIASDNKAYCWGYGNQGVLGIGSTSNSLVPVAVDTSGVLSGKTIVDISVGYYSVCVVDSNGAVYCWGNGDNGELGNGLSSDSLVPVAVDTSGALSGKNIASVSVGNHHVCAIDSNSVAYCWGFDYDGELGNNSTTNSSTPVAIYASGVLSGKTIKAISTGDYHSCALASDNQLYCWGDNSDGQLGVNDWNFYVTSVPVKVVNP